VRFSFDNLGLKPSRASFPELVDLKITDYCDKQCPYCYQASSVGGIHAADENITNITHALEKMGVFEVAIGGGEPMSHPSFLSILQRLGRCGIVANFSTREIDWLALPWKSGPILDSIGAFAVSVTDSAQVEVLSGLMTLNSIPKKKVTIQCVIGVVTSFGLSCILEAAYKAGIRVTLLGFKEMGLGKQFKREECNWVPIVKEFQLHGKCPSLAVDTVLARQAGTQLQEMGVPEQLYETQDGLFNMYIDAVTMKCGLSSYMDPKDLISIDEKDIYGSIEDAFQIGGGSGC
jgi:hypothetical protein